MEQFELNAEPRTLVGKGASRRLRRTGKVPGIVYGTDKEPTSIQLDHDNLMHHLEKEAFYSHILTLKIGKESQEVVLRDLQRHPFKARLMHIDLQRISASEKITMRVPLHIINEANCPGVKDEKGIVNSQLTQLEVICLPKDLPEYIEVDIIDMHMGDSIHLHELKLPEGIELEIVISGGDVNQAVVSVQQPQVEQVDEPEVEEGIEDAEADAAPGPDEEKPDSD
jgi:large subunit ribosomal protein L25